MTRLMLLLAVAAFVLPAFGCGVCNETDLVGTFAVVDPPEEYLATAELSFEGNDVTITYVREGHPFVVKYLLVHEEDEVDDSGDSGDSGL